MIMLAHASVRLYPPSDGADHWVAFQLVSKERFLLTSNAAFLLVYFMEGEYIDEGVARCCRDLSLSYVEARELIDNLILNKLLVSDRDPSHVACLALSSIWLNFGWAESFDHYLLAYDYPFINYDSPEAMTQDRERMQGYRSSEIEPPRYKSPNPAFVLQIACQSITDALTTLNTSVGEFFSNVEQSSGVSEKDIQTICTTALGILRTRPIPNCPDVPPLIRKTSPSGGARHPTDAHLMILSVDGLQPGIYQYSVAENALVFIKPLPKIDILKTNMEGVFRASFDIRAIIILTSVFERNMFRYREPRTFRTVFMDAGHVAATIEIITKSLGKRSYVQHGINDAWVESQLDLEALHEGALFGIGLG